MINGILYGVIIFVAFLATLWCITRHSEEKTFLRAVTLGSLCYGVLIAVLVRTIFGAILEDPAYFPDAYYYIRYATQKAAEWYGRGILGYIPLPTRGYTYFIAIIYSIFGQNIYAVIFVQLLLASLIPILTFSIACDFFSVKTAKLSAFIVAFFPDLYVWASFVLKETIAVFSICLAVLQFLRLRKYQNLTSFLTIIVPLGFLLFVRPHIALFLGLVFALAYMWPFKLKKLILLSVGIVAFAIFMSQAGLPNFLTIISVTPLYIYSRGEIIVTGTLPELLRMILTNPQILFNLLLGISRYLISPLPWQASNAYQAVVPGIILWYFIFPTAIWGAMGAIRTQKHVYILLLIVLFLIFWHGLISTGTDPRWRLMIVPFMAILSAYGFQLLAKNLSGAIIWISGALAIWIFISIYTLGLKFLLLVFLSTFGIGMLLSLSSTLRRVRGAKR